MKTLPKLEDFPSRTQETVRFSDCDMQGHVNNAVFATFMETGRVHALRTAREAAGRGSFRVVVVRAVLNYHHEVLWPGTVEIGSAVEAIGRSSVTFAHGIFQNGVCVCTGESVIVRIDPAHGKSMPIDDEGRAAFAPLLRGAA